MTKEKTLSQQICELCGVEAKLNVEKSYKEKRNIKDIYPDFENPENFVKLYELNIQKDLPVSFAEQCGICSSRAEFLNNLYNLLLEKAEYRKSIRNYDGWVWG